MATKVIFHKGSLGSLLKSDEVAAVLREKAEPVASAARASAAVDTGEYRDGIKVITEMHPGRVVVHVAGKAPHSWIVEADTGNLAKALGSA